MENTLHVGDRVAGRQARLPPAATSSAATSSSSTAPTRSRPRAPSGAGATRSRASLRAVGGARRARARRTSTTSSSGSSALPGDHVVCCDAQGRITVNGVPLDEPLPLPGRRAVADAVRHRSCPPGRLWVMGDHRGASADSRAHLGDPGGGTVPEDRVIGRARAIVWPFGDIGRLGVPTPSTQPALPRRAPSAVGRFVGRQGADRRTAERPAGRTVGPSTATGRHLVSDEHLGGSAGAVHPDDPLAARGGAPAPAPTAPRKRRSPSAAARLSARS